MNAEVCGLTNIIGGYLLCFLFAATITKLLGLKKKKDFHIDVVISSQNYSAHAKITANITACGELINFGSVKFNIQYKVRGTF